MVALWKLSGYDPIAAKNRCIEIINVPFIEVDVTRGTSQPSSGGLSRGSLLWGSSGLLGWSSLAGSLEKSLNLHCDIESVIEEMISTG
jgi:hypothetical protein